MCAACKCQQSNNGYSLRVTNGRIHGLNASPNEIQTEEPTKGIPKYCYYGTYSSKEQRYYTSISQFVLV